MRRYGYVLTAGLFFLWGCNQSHQVKDTKKDLAEPAKDNFIILLDVSDRILFNNQQQVPKDIDLIKSIYSIFKSKLDAKDSTHQYYGINDKLKLLAAPHWFYATVDFSAEQPDKKASMPDKTEKTFNTLLPEIYKEAISGNNGTAYSGVDIWKYFNDFLTEDLEKDGQNTLFIVSDGYMSPKKTEAGPFQNNRYASSSQVVSALKTYPDWEARFTEGDYGLLPVRKKFSNLQVILLQLNPKEDWPDEYSLLTKIWSKWFSEMGISNYHFIKNDSIAAVKESLGKLMNVKMDGGATTENWAVIPLKDSAQRRPVATKDTIAMREPIVLREKTVTLSAPAINTSLSVRKPIVVKRANPATPDVLPPDESDTRLLNIKKTVDTRNKKTTVKESDDILQDAGATNGFNTGIKKDNKKKNP